MKHIRVLLLFLCSTFIYADLKIPHPHAPGLLIPDGAVPLSQVDFASGSYRITKSGYYYLAEDIVFNPDPVLEAQRTDMPPVDEWFTGLSIECDNVVLDLNTKTIEVSVDFLSKQLLKVFSLVELSNTPFPAIKKEFGYAGIQHVAYPRNITIKNGVLGRSPHHGIHGNNNADVQIYDLVVRDWEVAGIALNGLKSGVIRNISISGMEHDFSFTGLISVMMVARFLLEQLVTEGDAEAQNYIAPLDAMIANPAVNGSIHPSNLNYGNTYGIFLNRMFDIGPVVSSHSPITTNTVLIEDVRIANIKVDTLEEVILGDAQGNPIQPVLFGSIRWLDAYQNNVFGPNALFKAQIYILNRQNPKALPEGCAQNILSAQPSEELFLQQLRPVFNRDFAFHAQKGIFGIRVDAGHGVVIRNCSILGIDNIGRPGATLVDIPGGSNYTFIPGRYMGNDIHGIALSVCDNCTISNCDVSACASTNGYVYGISVINQSEANSIESCNVTGLHAQRDDIDDPVNPSSKLYGYYCANASNSNQILHCAAQNLSSPRWTYGMYTEGSRGTMIDEALCSQHIIHSNNYPQYEELACGIASIGCHGTSIRNSMVREIVCANNSNNATTKTIGYLSDGSPTNKDNSCIIDNCIAECNDGGYGIAAGVYLDNAQEPSVTSSLASHTTSASKQGYGIFQTTNANNSIVLSNQAYANNKNYENNGSPWPTLHLKTNNIHSPHLYNPWYNISIDN